MALIGEPPATPERLLPLEIKEWIRRWKEQGLTLTQARAQARLLHRAIGAKRGKAAATDWWNALVSADKRLQ